MWRSGRLLEVEARPEDLGAYNRRLEAARAAREQEARENWERREREAREKAEQDSALPGFPPQWPQGFPQGFPWGPFPAPSEPASPLR